MVSTFILGLWYVWQCILQMERQIRKRKSSWKYTIITPPLKFYCLVIISKVVCTKILIYMSNLWDRCTSEYIHSTVHCNKAHLDLQKSRQNIVTASTGCKEITTQSCFRYSDISLTCIMNLQGSESLYCYLCEMKSLRWLVEDINRCFSVLWIGCSCVVLKEHIFTFWLGS